MIQTARILAILALCLSAWPTLAWSQDDDDDESELDPLDADPLPSGEVPEGATENPNAVPEFDETIEDSSSPEVKKVRTGYPIEIALRPLTLASGMSEISLDVPANIDPLVVTGLLRARYGVTRQIQIGLAYGPGAVTTDGFSSGKTVAPEFHYLIENWVSAQVSLPILMDPFSMGVTIGAPMKFRFGDRFAILTGHDLVNIRIHRFVPSVSDAALNEALVAADETNTTLDRGELRILAAVIYQLDPDLALMGETGILARDFGLTDAGVPLAVRLFYSMSNKLDLGGRIGFNNLDNALDNFGANVFIAVRI